MPKKNHQGDQVDPKTHTPSSDPSPTHPMTRQAQLTQVNKGITASGNMNKHRGDRRDMNKAYTGNQRHAARGNTPRVNVATRKA